MTSAKRHYDLTFDSVTGLVEFDVAPRSYNVRVLREVDDERNYPGRDWYGTSSLRELKRLVKYGWSDGTKRIRKLADEIVGQPRSMVRRRRAAWAGAGDELNIHAVNSGSLDRAWRTTKRVHKRSPRGRVRIVLNIGSMGSQKSTDLFWPPATGLALATWLLKNHFSVEIVGVSEAKSVTENGSSVRTSVMLKKMNQPLNADALSAVALAGFKRHYVHRARCSVNQKVDTGLGCTNFKLTPEEFASPGITTLVANKIYDRQKAIEWIKEAIETIEKGNANG